MKDMYYDQAVACVKDRVLPAQLELYQSCNGDLDRVYGEAMNGNGCFGRVVEPGRVYELGYERCTCPKVLSGQISDPDLCNCSRQSILYILGRLEPSSDFEVEIMETVLRGAEHCRFRITKKVNRRLLEELSETAGTESESSQERFLAPPLAVSPAGRACERRSPSIGGHHPLATQ